MPEITIRQPFLLELDTLNIEDSHLQTINFSFLVLVKEYVHSFTYKGSFWMEVEVFDRFLADLKSSSASKAVFHDIDFEFSIHINKSDSLFEWKSQRKTVGDGVNPGVQVNASFTTYFPHDYYADLVRAFHSYPKWW